MYVRMYVCRDVSMYVCTCLRVYVCTYVRMYLWMDGWMDGCMHVRMHVNKQTKNIIIITIIIIIIMVAIKTYKNTEPWHPNSDMLHPTEQQQQQGLPSLGLSRLVLPYAILCDHPSTHNEPTKGRPCILQEGQETLKASPETSKMSCLWCFLDFA